LKGTIVKWIIVKGNVIDGLTFIGPFEERDNAVQYGDFEIHQSDDWCIAELEEPEE
jgi:hypothetical protein